MAEIIRFRAAGADRGEKARDERGRGTVINHKLHELVAAEDKLAPQS